jgi:hypothetical protein
MFFLSFLSYFQSSTFIINLHPSTSIHQPPFIYISGSRTTRKSKALDQRYTISRTSCRNYPAPVLRAIVRLVMIDFTCYSILYRDVRSIRTAVPHMLTGRTELQVKIANFVGLTLRENVISRESIALVDEHTFGKRHPLLSLYLIQSAMEDQKGEPVIAIVDRTDNTGLFFRPDHAGDLKRIIDITTSNHCKLIRQLYVEGFAEKEFGGIERSMMPDA